MASNKPKKRGNRAGDNKKMGTKRSKRHRHEDLAAPGDSCLIDAIDHEDFRRLWSYNSTSGGRYVYITNDTAPE
ncbi:Hypothetical predicted protein, partial [Paramuricea clavata]